MGQDLRFALRTLFKNRTVTVVAIVSLALIVAGNTVVFSIVNSLLIKPLPFDPEGRLLLVWRSERARVFDRRAVSTADYHDYRECSRRVFEELAAYRGDRRNLTAAGDPEELAVAEAGAPRRPPGACRGSSCRVIRSARKTSLARVAIVP